MTDEKLLQIYYNHANDFCDVGYCFVAMQYGEFARAIKDYEAEKAKQITSVEPSDTEIIEYYEQVAKEDFPEKKTCKWKDASTYSIIRPNKKIAPLYVSPHLSKIEGQRGCFISKQDLSNYEYCPYPGCGKPIEVVK